MLKQKRIFNSSFAVYYENIINKISSPIYVDRWRKKIVRSAFKLKPKSSLIVDYCSGAGNIGKYVLREKEDILMINVDISKPLIKRAKENLRKAQSVCADNVHMPLKTESVDIIFSSFCIRNSPAPERTIEEVYRTLKPGGLWAILDFFRSEKRAIYYLLNEFIFKSFMKFNMLSGKQQKEAIDYLFKSIENFYTLGEFKKKIDNCFEVEFEDGFMGGVANGIILKRRLNHGNT